MRRRTTPVHPRASGERLRSRPLAPAPHRFIPARAGNAGHRHALPGSSSVHPRASGERWGAQRNPSHRCGSSPRERGTPSDADRNGCPIRFIPARAGNARRHDLSQHPRPVHPRASGERGGSFTDPVGVAGSSPRERGTLNAMRNREQIHRFIPARAGNAFAQETGIAAASVHPRASGERDYPDERTIHIGGSSPRERGTPGSAMRPISRWPVHPRASGERVSPANAASPKIGSSPRERGTPRAGGPYF